MSTGPQSTAQIVDPFTQIGCAANLGVLSACRVYPTKQEARSTIYLARSSLPPASCLFTFFRLWSLVGNLDILVEHLLDLRHGLGGGFLEVGLDRGGVLHVE